MTQLEQQAFVKDLMQSFQNSLEADFIAGRIPEHWNGRHLRMYILRRVSMNCMWGNHWAEFVKQFESDCLVNNL